MPIGNGSGSRCTSCCRARRRSLEVCPAWRMKGAREVPLVRHRARKSTPEVMAVATASREGSRPPGRTYEPSINRRSALCSRLVQMRLKPENVSQAPRGRSIAEAGTNGQSLSGSLVQSSLTQILGHGYVLSQQPRARRCTYGAQRPISPHDLRRVDAVRPIPFGSGCAAWSAVKPAGTAPVRAYAPPLSASPHRAASSRRSRGSSTNARSRMGSHSWVSATTRASMMRLRTGRSSNPAPHCCYRSNRIAPTRPRCAGLRVI